MADAKRYEITVVPKAQYVADQSDSVGNLFVTDPNVSVGSRVFPADGGPTTVPEGQNHGSVMVGVSTGTLAEGTLKVYTLDEDLTPRLRAPRRYDVGGGPLPSNVTGTIVAPGGTTNPFLINANDDLDVHSSGKVFATQNRFGGTDASSLFILNPDGTIFWESLVNAGNPDPLRLTRASAISPDEKLMALITDNGDVNIVPLLPDGTPDVSNLLFLNAFTETNVIQGREVAFDAAGNLYVLSSGYRMLRIFSPGGTSTAVTSFDGTNFTFSVIPEPGSFALLGAAGLFSLRRRRR